MANNVSHMSAILYIDNHTLSVRLRIKQSAYGQLNYVVSVYDPNDTNVAVRGTHRTARGFLSLDKFISSGPDAQTRADRYVRNCAIAILPLLPEGVPGYFHGYRDTNAICPYTSIGNVVNNGHRPDSTAYYIIQTVAHTP